MLSTKTHFSKQAFKKNFRNLTSNKLISFLFRDQIIGLEDEPVEKCFTF